MRILKKFYKFFVLAALFFFTVSFIIGNPLQNIKVNDTSAQSIDQLNAQLNQLVQQESNIQQKINQDKAQSNSLNGQIGGLQEKINADQDIISQKEQLISVNQSQMDILQKSIDAYISQIADLENKITSLRNLMNNRAKANYENTYINPLQLILGNNDINSALTSVAYFDSTMTADQKLSDSYTQSIDKLNKDNAQLLFQKNQLQTILTQLQQDENSLVADKSNLQSEEGQLMAQKNNVDSNTSQLKHQLSATQAQYESILNQMNSLYISSYSGGGSGCVGGNSWYYNQQCYGTLPGMYGTYINMVDGCLITSIAMVATKELGQPYTPPRVAGMTWFSNNWMQAWPEIPGLSPVNIGANLSSIDNSIAQGYPAIVYVNAPAGQHWIVMYAKLGNGDYLINDPWYGSGLRFLGTGGGSHEYYSFSEIGDAYILQ